MSEKPHYGSTTFPPPRPFQVSAHEALRQGIRDGHKNQMLMAATASGKTYLGLRNRRQREVDLYYDGVC